MISVFEPPYWFVRLIGSAIYWYLKKRSYIGSGAIAKHSVLGRNIRIGMQSLAVTKNVSNYTIVTNNYDYVKSSKG